MIILKAVNYMYFHDKKLETKLLPTELAEGPNRSDFVRTFVSVYTAIFRSSSMVFFNFKKTVT